MIHTKHILPIFLVSASFSAWAVTEPDSIPYGEQELHAAFGYLDTRDSYTGAQSSVKANQIDEWKGNSLQDAIRGKLSGWYNGIIRGMNSNEGNEALIVLDGIPMPFMSLTDLDPTTVAEVTLLKDAAAKALYGPQGAQGVVLITSKHGKNNSMTVNISGNVGFKKATRNPEMLNAYGQALLRNTALTNDGLSPKFSASDLDAFRNGTGIDNDWRDMYMDDMLFQKYNVQVGAGSEKVRFYINAGFSRETGKYNTSYDEKYN
ncbi:MAG: TonB-dependent receptor plug domain-containing protein, partial [Duncaniella sp.]|nr:TonB-dependent receptor plug domain-containing protein [Duncaniella sp.]